MFLGSLKRENLKRRIGSEETASLFINSLLSSWDVMWWKTLERGSESNEILSVLIKVKVRDSWKKDMRGPHMNGTMLAMKTEWLTMFAPSNLHSYRFVKTCRKCPTYANLNHLPPSLLHNLPSPWPFSTRGMDIIGQISPRADHGHHFLLVVAVDYFTKKEEAASFSRVPSKLLSSSPTTASLWSSTWDYIRSWMKIRGSYESCLYLRK